MSSHAKLSGCVHRITNLTPCEICHPYSSLICGQKVSVSTGRDKQGRLVPYITIEAAKGSWLDRSMLLNSNLRRPVIKTIREYETDQNAWSLLTEQQKRCWVAPDWYRSETDQEMRNRLNVELAQTGAA